MRAIALALLVASTARAQPVTLRMSTVAPEGSTWANLLKAFGQELASLTNGQARIKWYFGSVTGDELETFAAIQKGHLDGIASGGMICERIAPTMRIRGMTGVFQSRDEAAYVMDRMQQTIREEAHGNGFQMLITTGLGSEVLFTRSPVRTLADLRKVRLWRWSADDVGIAVAKEMGLKPVGTDLAEAARAYDDGKIDGFIAIPTAALAFQWSAQARYITDLRTDFLTGCIAVADRAFDRLPIEHQKNFRAILAKYDALFEETGRKQDDALLGGLFEKQGLKPVPPSEAFHSEFFEAAKAAREKAAPRLVPPALLDRVLKMLADYRAEHSPPRR